MLLRHPSVRSVRIPESFTKGWSSLSLFVCDLTYYSGGGEKESDAEERENDYEAAERRIFEAEKNAIENVEKAIEEEVATLYHEMPHHEKKGEVSKEKNHKKSVAVPERWENSFICHLACETACYLLSLWLFACLFRDEGDEKHDDYKVAEDKIFEVVENAEKKVLSAAHKAEKAVEHAIHDEVNILFPDKHENS